MKDNQEQFKLILLFTIMLIIALFGFYKVKGQSNFFRYSTFYVSGSLNSPLTEQSNYQVIRNEENIFDIPQIINTTEVNDYNYNLTIGIRKLARFKYENRANVFYDGSEDNVTSQAPIGVVKGFEYLANFSMIRNRGEEFYAHEYWLRHLGEYTLIKIDYTDRQDIQLKHYGVDVRGRFKYKNFNFTAGVKQRTHPTYGYNPFNEEFNLQTDAWWAIAYDLGYVDEYWSISDFGDYYWYDENGNVIAESDQEFMKYHFGRAIDEYNKRRLDELGMQQELSAIFGVSYYKYTKDFWVHSWLDIMPFHYGLSEYSFADIEHPVDVKGIPPQYDWDFGLIVGTKLTEKLGVFVEGFHQRYWCIKNYNLQFGINYLFK